MYLLPSQSPSGTAGEDKNALNSRAERAQEGPVCRPRAVSVSGRLYVKLMGLDVGISGNRRVCGLENCAPLSSDVPGRALGLRASNLPVGSEAEA